MEAVQKREHCIVHTLQASEPQRLEQKVRQRIPHPAHPQCVLRVVGVLGDGLRYGPQMGCPSTSRVARDEDRPL